MVDASTVGICNFGIICSKRFATTFLFSKCIKPAESKYNTLSRELLAAYETFPAFSWWATVYSFHLSYIKKSWLLLYQRKHKYLPRDLRYLDSISQYSASIRCIKPVRYLAWTLTFFTHSKFYWLATSCVGSKTRWQIIASSLVGVTLFLDIHQLSLHFTDSCIYCQKIKVQHLIKTHLSTFAIPDVCFKHIHMSIVGPLPQVQDNIYLMTCIDRFSRWPEAIRMKKISSLRGLL